MRTCSPGLYELLKVSNIYKPGKLTSEDLRKMLEALANDKPKDIKSKK